MPKIVLIMLYSLSLKKYSIMAMDLILLHGFISNRISYPARFFK